MVYTKYKFTPYDIAGYLLYSDFPYKQNNEIIEDLFKNHNASIVYPYRLDFLSLKSKTADLIILLGTDGEILNEAELILKELNDSKLNNNECELDYFGAYFKLIKLQLLYSGITYRKIKLRTLLKDFGYKRRTSSLLININYALRAIGLCPYLKKYKHCDLRKVKLDDMIIIRLRDNE